MKDMLDALFKSENIEYYRALSYDKLRVLRPYLTERAGISPRTAVIFLIPYYTVEGVNISSYAVSRDYHLYSRELFSRLIKSLCEAFPEYKFTAFADHSPIDERQAALLAGLGVIGDNGLIINEKYGSYIFIAELLTDAPPSLLGASLPAPILTCTHCGACKRACPGKTLSAGGDCLSMITQKKGELSREERLLLREENTAWGCDACQRVCPYNKHPVKTPISFFHESLTPALSRESVLSMSDEEFSERAYSWRGREVVLRNLSLLEEK